jgi:hypothetical protein
MGSQVYSNGSAQVAEDYQATEMVSESARIAPLCLIPSRLVVWPQQGIA